MMKAWWTVFFVGFLAVSASGMTIEDFLKMDMAKQRNTPEGNLVLITAVSNELAKDPNNYELNWLFSAVLYFYGDYHEKDKEKKKAYFARCRDYAKKAVALNPNGPDGHYWLAIGYGKWSEANGILDSLFYADDIAAEMTRVIEINPKYFYGFPWAVRAKVYALAPGWPLSVGDKQKAYQDMETAAKYGSGYKMIFQFYAEILQNDGRNEEALQMIDKALALPIDQLSPMEDRIMISQLQKTRRQILKKLGRTS